MRLGRRNRRHWQVPGTPHSDVNSPVTPANEEVYRNGRLPRLMDQELIDALNVPVGAGHHRCDRVTRRLGTGRRAGSAVAMVRGERRRRTGPRRPRQRHRRHPPWSVDYPLATFNGASAPGSVLGSYSLMSREEFDEAYGSREAYLELIEESNARQIELST